MPNLKSSIKDVGRARRNRERNLAVESRLKSLTRAVRSAADAELARKTLSAAVVAWDRAVARGIVHRNTAARTKSRLSAFVRKRFA